MNILREAFLRCVWAVIETARFFGGAFQQVLSWWGDFLRGGK